jgi:hypothetical protein
MYEWGRGHQFKNHPVIERILNSTTSLPDFKKNSLFPLSRVRLKTAPRTSGCEELRP